MTLDPGSSPGLARILERLRVRLFEYASSKGMQDRADDVVQETLAVLWNKYAHIEAEADLVPLAYTICKFKILEARRGANWKLHGPLDERIEVMDPGHSAQEALEMEGERRRLHEAIDRLGPRCKQLFRLRLQESSTAQIAALMSASRATVYVWEHRCRKALFQELA